MRTKEFIGFVTKRAKSDSPLAFTCRMARFGVIACYLPIRMYNSWTIDQTFNGIKPLIEREIMGSKMLLDMEDKGLSRDLMLDDIREPFMTTALQKEIGKDDVCLDIGANIGYYVLQEARLARKVYAIEPVRESFDLLYRNVKLNKYNNVVCFQWACGDETKDIMINVSVKRNWSSIYPSNDRVFVRQDKVQMMCVDDIVFATIEMPTFIRMDVEGYEYEIIKGMSKLFSTKQPLKLFIEMHFDILREKTVELCKILKDAGFKVKISSIEPHPAISKSVIGANIVKLLEKGIGATTGYNKVTIDDLIKDKKYSSGQVEYMEVLYERV